MAANTRESLVTCNEVTIAGAAVLDHNRLAILDAANHTSFSKSRDLIAAANRMLNTAGFINMSVQDGKKHLSYWMTHGALERKGRGRILTPTQIGGRALDLVFKHLTL